MTSCSKQAFDIQNFQISRQFFKNRFQFIINYILKMKTKKISTIFTAQFKSSSQYNLEDAYQQSFETQKFKNDVIKNDTTVASLSQNEISSSFINLKTFQKTKNDDSTFEFTLNELKSTKSQKKKNISKLKLLRSHFKKGKFQNILRSSKPKNLKQKSKKPLKIQKKVKSQKQKQNIIVEKVVPIQSKKKVLIHPIKEEKMININLCQCAQIKTIGFDRRQLQKKRQDLLKRGVQNWELVDKGRSERRQLRNFNY